MLSLAFLAMSALALTVAATLARHQSRVALTHVGRR